MQLWKDFMKICWDLENFWLNGLRDKIIKAGKVTEKDRADLVITDDLSQEVEGKMIGFGIVIPEILSINFCQDAPEKIPNLVTPSFFITKYFEYGNFRAQNFIGFKVFEKSNYNTESMIVEGIACRYFKECSLLRYFEIEILIEFLKASKHNGFVSIEFVEGKVIWHLGIPSFGIYNVLRGMSKDYAKWFLNPQKLFESWTLSLLVTTQHNEAYIEEQESSNVCSSLFQLGQDQRKDSSQSLLVATGWGRTLKDAERSSLEVARQNCGKNSSYRIDVASQVLKSLDWVKREVPFV